MQIVMYDDAIANKIHLAPSVFLAGPTNRNQRTAWRTEAIDLFSEAKFNGLLFIPEFMDGTNNKRLDKEVIYGWEICGLQYCSVIMFWIPRSEKLPAYTTNIEFGMWHKDRRTMCGSPPDAIKMEYLQHLWKINNGLTPWYDNLKDLVYAISHRLQR